MCLSVINVQITHLKSNCPNKPNNPRKSFMKVYTLQNYCIITNEQNKIKKNAFIVSIRFVIAICRILRRDCYEVYSYEVFLNQSDLI